MTLPIRPGAMAYREGTMKIVARNGGRFLVRPDCPWEVLEGQPSAPDWHGDDRVSVDGERQGLVQRPRLSIPHQAASVGLDPRSHPRGEPVTRHSVMRDVLGGLHEEP